MKCIEAHGLRKAFGTTVALNGVDLQVEEGRILGLIGPNGAGKTTALNAIIGLTPYDGELKVLGRNPWLERDSVMRDVCFIADVAVLPRWIRVSQVLDYVGGVHPRLSPDPAADPHARGLTARRLRPFIGAWPTSSKRRAVSSPIGKATPPSTAMKRFLPTRDCCRKS